jgi:uroporphyrinogen decarboxylase
MATFIQKIVGDMTHRERLKTAADKKTPDMIPCWPYTVNYNARQWAYTMRQYNTDPLITAKGELASFNKHRYDGIGGFRFVGQGACEMGAKVLIQEDLEPLWDQDNLRVLDLVKDTETLEVPDPYTTGPFMNLVTESNTIVTDENRRRGIDVRILGRVMGPFTVATFLRGIEQSMFDLIERPEEYKKLTKICTETETVFGNAQIDTGATTPWISEPNSNSDFISSQQWDEFVLPTLQACHGAWHEHGAEWTMQHQCGDSTMNRDSLAESGADTVYPDSWKWLPIHEYVATIGKKVCLGLSFEITDTLLLGTPEDCREEGKQLAWMYGPKQEANGSACLYTSGCEVAPDMPDDNMDEMVNAAKEFGVYPIKPQW